GETRAAVGAAIWISSQSDREWRVLAEKVLDDKALAADPAFATNVERVKRRGETDARVAAVFGATDEAALTRKLTENDIAFARVNTTADLAVHPQLRRIEAATPSRLGSGPPARPRAAAAPPPPPPPPPRAGRPPHRAGALSPRAPPPPGGAPFFPPPGRRPPPPPGGGGGGGGGPIPRLGLSLVPLTRS